MHRQGKQRIAIVGAGVGGLTIAIALRQRGFEVLAATECVMPCFEIVDSRIRDWKIKIEDTVADNASCGVFVLGDQAVDPRKIDLSLCGMVLERNGEIYVVV